MLSEANVDVEILIQSITANLVFYVILTSNIKKNVKRIGKNNFGTIYIGTVEKLRKM